MSDGKSNSSIFIRLKHIPLHKDVERNPKVGKPSFEVIPGPMAHLLDMTHHSQHREYKFPPSYARSTRLYDRADVGMIAFGAVKAQIAQYDYTVREALSPVLMREGDETAARLSGSAEASFVST